MNFISGIEKESSFYPDCGLLLSISYNNSWAVVIVSIIKERAQSAQFHVLEIKQEMRIYNR